jgi:hypothetical protein
MQERLARRMFPLITSVMLIAGGMYGIAIHQMTAGRMAIPADYWHTLVAAVRLTHGDIGGLYTQPTALAGLPGAAAILLPVAAVINMAGLSLQVPGPHSPQPPVWLLAGPYEIALSCIALFAADALAERLGATDGRRMLLAVAGSLVLWTGPGDWGHPEDAVAVGLLLYAVLALSRARPSLAGWLAGAGVAVQPLILLALPVLVTTLPARRMPGFLLRATAPGAVLPGTAAIANWHATVLTVTSQPNSPAINHQTAWTSLAPHMSGGNVAAGPARALTILLACCCAFTIRRR